MKNQINYLLSFTISLLLILSSCTTPQTPTYIRMQDYHLQNVSFNKADMILKLVYHNDNNYGLDIKDIDLGVSVNNKYLGQAIMSDKVSINKKSDFTLPLTCHFNPMDLVSFGLSNLSRLSQNKKFQIAIKGSMKIGKSGVYAPVPIHVTDSISLH